MQRIIGLTITAGLILAATPAWAGEGEAMRAFRSDGQLERYLERSGVVSARHSEPVPPPMVVPMPVPPPMVLPNVAPAPPPPTQVDAAGNLTVTAAPVQQPMQDAAVAVSAVSSESLAASDNIVVTSNRTAEPNITNTQEANVDEGGIVKVHGRHLVVLRRGRLFTIDTADGGLRRVDQIDAFPPGDIEADGAWYDEMLVSGDMVIVIGYSYSRFGTEINRFRIDAGGRLSYLDTHHIRSQDYYSDRNYASRLVGNQLVVYSPIPVSMGDSWKDSLPGVKRWTGPGEDDGENTGFTRLSPANRIYLAEPLWNMRESELDTFHTVTICDLATRQFICKASAVLGTSSRTFYVSDRAVYVWTSGIDMPRQHGEVSFLYRLPLNGDAPQALETWGGPVDQFSFREDRADGMLNVVVRADSGGDSMWRPELSEGDAALLRVPLAAFGDGSSAAARRAYRDLPASGYGFRNRFVGRHLLYANYDYSEENSGAGLRAVPLDGGPIRWVPLPHMVSRLDVIGGDGVAIGTDENNALGFSAIALNSRNGDAVREDTYLFPNASEGESRSQAFFYRPDSSDTTGTTGTMALPIMRQRETKPGDLLETSAAITFLNRIHRRLSPAGELTADADHAVEDHCIASCVDWYGNARPIFLGNRTFALMGYELVEGRMDGGRIGEVRRINFAPVAMVQK